MSTSRFLATHLFGFEESRADCEAMFKSLLAAILKTNQNLYAFKSSLVARANSSDPPNKDLVDALEILNSLIRDPDVMRNAFVGFSSSVISDGLELGSARGTWYVGAMIACILDGAAFSEMPIYEWRTEGVLSKSFPEYAECIKPLTALVSRYKKYNITAGNLSDVMRIRALTISAARLKQVKPSDVFPDLNFSTTPVHLLVQELGSREGELQQHLTSVSSEDPEEYDTDKGKWHEVFLQVSPRELWVNKGTASCSKSADRQNHCGNVDQEYGGDEIVVLYRLGDDKKWREEAAAIFNDDRRYGLTIREFVGHKNSCPFAKYNQQTKEYSKSRNTAAVLALMLDPKIKMICRDQRWGNIEKALEALKLPEETFKAISKKVREISYEDVGEPPGEPCSQCDERTSEDDRYMCEGCEVILCGDCSNFCHEERQDRRTGRTRECESGPYCESCFKDHNNEYHPSYECAASGCHEETKNLEDFSTCEDCGESYCSSHIAECPVSGRHGYFCPDCVVEHVKDNDLRTCATTGCDNQVLDPDDDSDGLVEKLHGKNCDGCGQTYCEEHEPDPLCEGCQEAKKEHE